MATTPLVQSVTLPQAEHSYIAAQSPAPSTSNVTDHEALKRAFTATDFDVDSFMLPAPHGSTRDTTFSTSTPKRRGLSRQQTESLSGDVLRLEKELYEARLELVKEELSLVRKASKKMDEDKCALMWSMSPSIFLLAWCLVEFFLKLQDTTVLLEINFDSTLS